MGRQPCCDKVELQRGPWTIEEDHKLKRFILNNGIQCWPRVPKLAGLLRCGKSCRLRWINYLKPDLKRGPLSEVEENQIIQLHACLGRRWSKIASHFPGRTDNEIKNHWNTRIKKRLKQLGTDPVNHKPIEQNDKFEEETETIEQVSSPKGEDVTVDVKSSQSDFPDEGANSIKSENEVGVTSHETVNLVNRHEMLCGRLDKDLSMVRDINPCTSYSPSISIEDSLNPSNEQVNMGRQPRSDKVRLQRGPWTMEEDHKLKKFILNNGIQCWQMVPKRAGLLRCRKSCRLRWINYLKPDLKRGPLSEVEENQIIQLHARLGSRWSKIASHFPGRTDNEIKNHWNTRIKKRLKQLGADPGTHKPIEQNDKFEEETEAIEQQVSSPKGEDTTVDVKSSRNDFPDEGANSIKSENEVGVTSHETVDLVNRHEMLRWRLDKDLSMVRGIEPCTSYSPSISMEDSLNPSNGESISTQEESLQQQWVDSLDSSLVWSYFNQLDEELLFSKNH